MPHLGELALAGGLAALVLGSGVAVGARDHAHHAALRETMVAREAAEGLLELTRVRDLAEGSHTLQFDGLPAAARLPEAAARADVGAGIAGTRTVRVTLSWRGAIGARVLTLETVVR